MAYAASSFPLCGGAIYLVCEICEDKQLGRKKPPVRRCQKCPEGPYFHPGVVKPCGDEHGKDRTEKSEESVGDAGDDMLLFGAAFNI